MNVLIITDYAAPYEGNFIQSLKNLESTVEGEMFYLLSEKTKEIEWVKIFEKKHKVYYFSNETKKIEKIIQEIVQMKSINILYSHFCLLKTQKAVKKNRIFNKKIKLVQHFHNHYFNVKNPLYKWSFNGDLIIREKVLMLQ